MYNTLQPDQQLSALSESLLSLPEAEGLKAWQEQPREALLAEVAKYRAAIRDVSARLRQQGDEALPTDAVLALESRGAAPADGPASAAPAGPPDAAAAAAANAGAAQGEFSHLGEEGVDFTFGSVDDLDPSEWQVPPHCIPIHANVTTFDWPRLYDRCQFDVVMMDPPWQLATANPTRGVALGYSQLSDDHISTLPVPQLQREGGYLFVWVINAKYKWTLDLFDKWGYKLVDEVVWVKMTVNRRLAKSHGYYLQHAKEVCLVGKRGNPQCAAACGPGGGVGSDIIFSERRGQSQKPEEIYELVEQLVPNGRYLEIFARKNNLRNFWVSIGNEVTGTGLPQEDMLALRELHCIPGAVYGKNGGGGGAAAVAAAAAAVGSGAAARAGSSGSAAAPPAAAAVQLGVVAGAAPGVGADGEGGAARQELGAAEAQAPQPCAAPAAPLPPPMEQAAAAPTAASATPVPARDPLPHAHGGPDPSAAAGRSGAGLPAAGLGSSPWGGVGAALFGDALGAGASGDLGCSPCGLSLMQLCGSSQGPRLSLPAGERLSLGGEMDLEGLFGAGPGAGGSQAEGLGLGLSPGLGLLRGSQQQ